MKIPTNKIADVIQYYKNQLAGLYDIGEIQAFIKLSFDFYLGISPAQLMLKKDERLSESELLKFNFVVKRLKKFEPIQYIFGETEFYGLKFKVNPSVLIPRPETEELVDWVIKDYGGKPNLRILDVCTGSGCIAISLNKLLGSQVTALDISPEALKVAQENISLNHAVVDLVEYDILKQPDLKHKYDVIVSNPPYVTGEDKKQMHPNVLEYEPHLALFVEDSQALIFYEAIAKFAKNHLQKSGSLYFEINEAKGLELQEMLAELGYKSIVLKKDFSGKDRMLKCIFEG